MKKFTNYDNPGNLNYASKCVLKANIGERYSTVHTHISRVKPFLKFCQLKSIKYAEQITQELVEDYAKSIELKFSRGEIKVSYGHSLLSSVNELMRSFRRDNQIWLSPLEYLGPRSNIRKIAPNMASATPWFTFT